MKVNEFTGETLGEFLGYHVNLDDFDTIWRTLAKLGLQDSLGGGEYRSAVEAVFGISADLAIEWTRTVTTPGGLIVSRSKAVGPWVDAVRRLRLQQRAERKADLARANADMEANGTWTDLANGGRVYKRNAVAV